MSDDKEIPPHLLGSSFERAGYSEVTRVGEGSFGSVFLAWKDGKKVALKRLLGTVAPHRIVAEMELLERASVGSAGLVPSLFGGFRDSDGTVIAMTYFAHDDFKAYFNSLSWLQLQTYAHQLFSALAHVHSCGVIHRDVKPRNFLFNVRTGKGCLVDFGLAQSTALWDNRRAALEAHRDAKRMRPSASSSSQTMSVLSSSISSSSAALGEATRVTAASPMVAKGGVSATASVGGGTQSRRLAAALVSSASSSDHTTNAGAANTTPAIVAPVPLPACALTDGTQSGQLPKRPDRAGTPGFRAPEVLLYSMEQSPALDVWAAGVCVLGLLARRYPLFNCQDRSDEPWLLQVASLLGPAKVVAAAAELGKRVDLPSAEDLNFDEDISIGALFAPAYLPPHREGRGHLPAAVAAEKATRVDAGTTLESQRLSASSSFSAVQSRESESQVLFDSAVEFVLHSLEPSPRRRATAASALEMPFIKSRPVHCP
mmetsp:Transcript_61059/g.122411  ORF Transcript_61059/g.122411 Transcript_61059/m.122411 type:complete len:485 (-) Transcript_61059:203-1657(-)